MLCHLFNPENDMALASGLRRYTPPAAAMAVHQAGALLPLWWAGEADFVVAPAESGPFAARLRELYGLKGTLTPERGKLPDEAAGEPWGWSEYAVGLLSRAGVREQALPSAASLEVMRGLSHRRTSREFLRLMGVEDDLLPVEARSVTEALDDACRFGGDAYIKLPWSGSGRGVLRTASMSREDVERHVAGFLRRQGSVMVERTLAVRRCFAMLFHADGAGRITPRGVSCFMSSQAGAYAGNIVAPQSALRRLTGVSESELESLGFRSAAALQTIVGSTYTGWIGIDMATTEPEGSVWPCIEVNLRRTMGVAAMLIAERLPDSMLPGLLTFTPRPQADDLLLSAPAASGGAFVLRPSALECL